MGLKLIGAALLSTAVLFNSSIFAATVNGSKLRLLTHSAALYNPTGVAFLNRFDSLVTQKNDGKVLFLENGLSAHLALDLPVANAGNQGLLDIALAPRFSKNHFVYLYLTPAATDGDVATAAVINRYIWNSQKENLTFDKTVFTTPKDINNKRVDGLISFDPKGRPTIASGLLVGPNVINVKYKYANGLTGSTKIIHPGAGSLNPEAIVLMTNSARKKAKGTLALSSSAFSSATSLSNGTIILSHGTGIIGKPIGVGTIGNITLTKPVTVINNTQLLNGGTFVSASPLTSSGALVTTPLINLSTITISNPNLSAGSVSSPGAGILTDYHQPLTGQLQLELGAGRIQSGGTITTDSGAITLISGSTSFTSSGTLGYSLGTINVSNGTSVFSGGTLTVYSPPELSLNEPVVPVVPLSDTSIDATAAAASLTVVSSPEPTAGLLIFCGVAAMLGRRRRPCTA